MEQQVTQETGESPPPTCKRLSSHLLQTRELGTARPIPRAEPEWLRFCDRFEIKAILLKEECHRVPAPELMARSLVKAKLFVSESRLAGTWHAVNGLILQRNGGISRTEI